MTVVAVAVVAAAVGGTALAADSTSPNSFLDDFAQHLGVSPSKVQSAYQATITDRLNALVKAGKLTQQQANALEQHMKSNPGGPFMGGFGFGFPPQQAFKAFGGPPPFGGPPRFFGRHGGPMAAAGPFGALPAAASYLGVPVKTLMADLASGKTLAGVATAQHKPVAGLEAAMLAAATRQLDAAVKAGHLSSAMAAKIKTALSAHIDGLVQHGFEFRHPIGPWGGPGNGSAHRQVKPSTGASFGFQTAPQLGT